MKFIISFIKKIMQKIRFMENTFFVHISFQCLLAFIFNGAFKDLMFVSKYKFSFR